MISRLLDPVALCVVLCGVGLALSSRATLGSSSRPVRYGARLAWVGWLLLLGLSMPRVAVHLARWVEPEAVDVASAVAATPVSKRALVVLAAGFRDTEVPLPPEDRLPPHAMVRLMGAARLHQDIGFGEIIVSGTDGSEHPRALAEGMAAVLIRLGVPRERILLEPWSRTTRENAHFSAMILEQLDIDTVVVVTNALHVPRSLAEFRRAGVEAIGAPLDPEGRVADRGGGWIPSSGALLLSHRALHEKLGMWKPTWADPSPRWGGGPPPDWDPKAPLRP